MTKYYLYAMDVEPTDGNSPVGMNNLLGLGEYANPRNAMRYLAPSQRPVTMYGGQPAKWLGLFTRDEKVAHKEKLECK